MCIAHMTNDSCKPLILQKIHGFGTVNSQESNPCWGKSDGSSVPHPLDCSRYYICIQQSTSPEMQCPFRSYFNSSHGYCLPNDGSCRVPLTGPCANATDGSVVSHSSDCQAYYSCSSINGTELLRCLKGQYFDKDSLRCRADNGECEKKVIPQPRCSRLLHGTRLPHEVYCNIYYACVKGLTIPVECPENYQFNRTLNKCMPLYEHGQCHIGYLKNQNITYTCDNLQDGIFLLDFMDCTRYNICSEGQAFPKICPNSSYFENEQLLCVPDDGSCPFVNKDVEQQIAAPPDPSICDGKHGYLLPDPLNCNNFYACKQFFNTTLLQCQPKFFPQRELNGNTTLDMEMEVHKMNTPQCLDGITTLKILCSEMSEGTSLAEQQDCRRYITCQDSVEDKEPIPQRCRNGESFDSLLGFCRQNDGTCLLENGQRVGECSGKHGQLVRDPDNCRNYFVCINGQKILHACKDDEFFSRNQNMCIKDTQQACKPTQTAEVYVMQSCIGLSESALYPYIHDNCRSYFQCIKGVAKIHMCADDLYFDPLTIKCIKNKTECVMPTPTQQRSPALTQTFNKLCSNKKLDHPYTNVDNDCRSFYLCHANGDVSHELCPLGMIFDKDFLLCMDESKTSCT